MQSSGASLVTYFLGQAPRSVALVDVWIRHLTPSLPSAGACHVIAKCTLNTQFDFEQHAERFRPDRTVLILRDPVQNYASLQHKDYVGEGGPIDEKFAKLEEVFRERGQFDLTLAYEDFVARPEQTVDALRGAGIPAELDYYRFRRSTRKIKAFNFAHDRWCRQRYGFGWGFGNVQGSRLNPAKLYRPVAPELEVRVRALCPSVCAYYDEHHSELSATATTISAIDAGFAAPWTSYLRRLALLGASSAKNP
jgi:hypothetical protein